MPFFVLRTARRSGLVAFGSIARITYPETLPRAGNRITSLTFGDPETLPRAGLKQKERFAL